MVKVLVVVAERIMSRRKQARPSRVQDDQPQEEQENIKPDFDDRKTNQNDIDNDKKILNNNFNQENGDCVKQVEDANNNNDANGAGQLEKDTEEDTEKATAMALQSILSNLQWPTATNAINLESLQNTKIAMAQFAANALTAGAVQGDNIQDLAVNLSTTLFTLQQQQLLQLQLIQQLQNQLHVSNSNSENEEEDPPPPTTPLPPASERGQAEVTPPPGNASPQGQREAKSPTVNPTESKGLTTSLRNSNLTSSDGLNPAFASLLNCANQDPNRPLSPGLPPSQEEWGQEREAREEQPNTLEMLQKRAQEVLDSASQGLLASSLADDPRKKLGPYEKGREPFFKHRCRYCGKVFGSDSALQIHIRSHTGERPFKCNVCGSRFTTKGNLKVHFQRHTSKFPHVKMNPHPVPEHLDAFHPPLLSGSNSGGPSTPEQQQSPTHNHSSSTPIGFLGGGGGPTPAGFHPFSPLFRFDLKPALGPAPQPYLLPETATPQDLTKPKTADPSEEEEEDTKDSRDTPEVANGDADSDNEGSPPLRQREEPEEEENSQDQPENLSSKSLPLMYPLPLMVHPPRPSSSSNASTAHAPHPPRQMLLRPSPRPPSSPSPRGHGEGGQAGHPGHPGQFDPAKDPAIYTNLLPRPGSNDNAWESLIEVTKTSETSKLQQLVDNIEHKMTDPNQCIICHRVLSCKSALQMHYRTHTGERPFKCKICGRAFTTKGNLKTHMGVHRAKPPLRVLHQCPVCHKRFTNSLVLQQHIRLHTGEPTDLTPDQIRAAEVRDPYPSFPGFAPYGGFLGHHHHHPSSLLSNDDQQSIIKSEVDDDLEDDLDDDLSNDLEDDLDRAADNEQEGSPRDDDRAPDKPTTSLAALENQVRTITTSFATQMLSHNKRGSPASPPLPPAEEEATLDLTQKNGLTRPPDHHNHDSCSSSSSAAGESWGAKGKSPGPQGTFAPLDLTPRTMFNPFLMHQPHLVHHQSLIAPPNLNQLANSVLNSGFSLVPPPPPPPPNHHHPRQFSEGEGFLWTSRGNTTCQICLKTFACNSALEIHYRSHTKERPFKCGVCSRGFSTKGNMKQHMLTHKIRDMGGCSSSNNSFDSKTKSPSGQQSEDDSTHSDSPPPTTTTDSKPSPSPSHSTPPSGDEDSHQGPPPPKKQRDASPPSPPAAPNHHHPQGLSSPEEGEGVAQGGQGKHVCRVCSKNFSSSSALHIHSRTHSGERPFKCNVCQKAFTTKGNLKVHMGTHMWTSGVSRRGRRMSLDPLSVFLPLPPSSAAGGAPHHPLHIKKEPQQGRAAGDLFYPYAPQNPLFHPNGALNEAKPPPPPPIPPQSPVPGAAAAPATEA